MTTNRLRRQKFVGNSQGLLKVWIWTQVLAMCTTGPGWQWIYAWQKTRSNLAMSNTQNKNKGSCQKETFLYQLLIWKEFILVREKLKWHLFFFPFWPSVKLRKSSWHNIFLLRQRKRLDSLKKQSKQKENWKSEICLLREIRNNLVIFITNWTLWLGLLYTKNSEFISRPLAILA